jgi:Xaa-Pro aminopeptidase
MTERAIAAEIVYQHLKRGAERMAFDPIVASGPNGALPHARPTNRKLQRGDLVVIDMGGFVDGYASDMTRTVAIGSASDEACTHYTAVLEAQRRAIDTIHAGMTGAELDSTARHVLDDAGLGQYFTHSLGHGIGLQTHEWPRLSQRVEHVLPEGATVTIEPGVYMPDQHGIRIEDIVVVREEGCDNLTGAPKHLIEL